MFSMYSCTNDDVMDIRGDSGFARFLTVSKYTKLLSVRPKKKAVLPKCWREVVEEYFMASLQHILCVMIVMICLHVNYVITLITLDY